MLGTKVMFLTKNWLCKLSFTERSVIEIYTADYISKKNYVIVFICAKERGTNLYKKDLSMT